MKLIIGVYFVVQILLLSSLMVLEIKLTLHSILIAFASILYLIVSFKNPGYYKSNVKLPDISDQVNEQKRIKKAKMKQIHEVNEYQQQDINSINNNQTTKFQNYKSQRQQQQQEQQKEKEKVKHKSLNYIDNSKKKSKNIIHKKEKKENQNNQKSEKQQEQEKQIEKQIQQQKQKNNKNIIQKNGKKNNKQMKRYCRVCMTIQPLRVRHCHQCDQCIYTFDHHCPWMDNCIGQKNRFYFWLFLFVQSIQFLCIDISVLNQISSNLQLKHAYFFFIGLLMISFVSFALLGFHTYLILKNLTTWEYIRWDRIQYLKIFKKRQSPFSSNWKNNIYDYIISFWQQQPFQWVFYNQMQKQKQKQKSKRQIKIKMNQNGQTQRGLVKTNQVQN